MVVERLIVVRRNIAAGKHLLEMLEEVGIHRHDVFEMTMEPAILDHQNLAVAFENRGLNFSDSLVHENTQILPAIQDLATRLAHTDWTK